MEDSPDLEWASTEHESSPKSASIEREKPHAPYHDASASEQPVAARLS